MTSPLDRPLAEFLPKKLEEPKWTVNGKPTALRTVDSDTLQNPNGDRYRASDFNAPEAAKTRAGMFIPGGAGEGIFSSAQSEIINAGGFTDIVPTGKKDVNNREIARYQNKDSGVSLGSVLTAMGMNKVTRNTPTEVMDEAAAMNAAAVLMPEKGSKDPIRAVGEKYRQAEKEQFGGQTVAGVRRLAATPQEFAAANSMVGFQAANEAQDEIKRLSGILSDPTQQMKPETRIKLTEDLLKARQHLYGALTTSNPYSGVMLRRSDRDIMNRANDQFYTSLRNAGYDALKTISGNAEMAATSFGWDDLKANAKSWSHQIKAKQQDLPSTLSAMSDIRTDNPWDAISDTTTYLTNQVAGMIPYVAAMTVAGLATGGAGAAAASSAMYAGKFYADQAEDQKNAGLALALGVSSGALDALGLGSVLGKGTINLMTKEGRDLAVKAAVAKAELEGLTLSDAAAMQMLETQTKRELVELAKFSANTARQQIASTEAAMRGMASLLGKTGAESGTEVAQQYAEMMAVSGKWDTDIQYEKGFYDQLVNAAAGGAALGGTFAGAKMGWDAAEWHSIANGLGENTQAMEDYQLYQAHQRNKIHTDQQGDAFLDIKTEARKMSREAAAMNMKGIKEFEGADNAGSTFKYLFSSPLQLVRGLGSEAVRSIRKKDGTFKEYSARLKALIGGYGIAPGEHAMRRKQNLIGSWGGIALNKDWLSAQMETNYDVAQGHLKDAWDRFWSKTNTIGMSLPDEIAAIRADEAKLMADPTLAPHAKTLTEFRESLANMRSSISTESARAASGTTDLPLLVSQVFSRPTVEASTLAANKPMIDAVARDIAASQGESLSVIQANVDKLLANNVADAEQASAYLASIGLLTDPRLSSVFKPDVFTNLENAKARYASRVVAAEYLGEEGKTLSYLIAQADANGEFESDLERMQAIAGAKAFYEIFHSEYRPINNELAEKVLGWVTTMTMLSGLGKAAFSSLPEVAFAALGTSGDLVQRQLLEYTKALKSEIGADFNKAASWTMSKRLVRSIAQMDVARASPLLDNQEAMANLQKEGKELSDAIDTAKKLNVELDNPAVTKARLKEIQEELKVVTARVTGYHLFHNLGYAETGYNAATRYELNDTRMRNAMQLFATMIGLRAQTDATRIGILAVAGDVLTDKFQALLMIPESSRAEAFATGKGLTNEQAGYLKELQSYGFDVNSVLNLISDNQHENGSGFMENLRAFSDSEAFDAKLNGLTEQLRSTRDPKAREAIQLELQKLRSYRAISENMQNAIGNFVDAKAVNPQIHNLPRFYHDPRMRVFTAMTRFVATQTAEMLPRLYRGYVARGNAAMRYQAFAVVVGALLASATANVLKDLLAYGDSENPYLKSQREKAQRALYGAGLLGQWERPVSAIVPLYPDRAPRKSDNAIEAASGWIWDNLKDNSPQISWLAKAGTAAGSVIEGDLPTAGRDILRAAPVTGSYPIVPKMFKESFEKE